MVNEPEDQDLRDLMREEKSRGKRRIDPAEHRRRQELLKGFRDALDARTEREFLEAIKLLGLGDDPLKHEKALKIWRTFSRQQPSGGRRESWRRVRLAETRRDVPAQDRRASGRRFPWM